MAIIRSEEIVPATAFCCYLLASTLAAIQALNLLQQAAEAFSPNLPKHTARMKNTFN
jgi:hypothetical protein